MEFLQFQLSRPGVSLTVIASATGISERCISMMKAGRSNATISRVNEVARFLGYRFVPVPIKPPRLQRQQRGASAPDPLDAEHDTVEGEREGSPA